MRKYAKIPETNFEVADPTAVLQSIDTHYAPLAKEVLRIDGLRFDFDDWWFCVRASNTEPLLRLNLECKTQSMLTQRFEELSRAIGGNVHH